VLTAAVETKYDLIVFSRPGITQLEQLKGKKIGITGFNSATHGHGRYGDIKRDADLGQDDADMPACGIVEAGNRDVCVVQEFAAPNQAQTAEADENYQTQAVDVQQSVGGRRGLSFWSKDQQTALRRDADRSR
jgi:hypothetical protein